MVSLEHQRAIPHHILVSMIFMLVHGCTHMVAASDHRPIELQLDLFIAFVTQFQTLNIFPLTNLIQLGNITHTHRECSLLAFLPSTPFIFSSSFPFRPHTLFSPFYSSNADLRDERCALSRIERFLSTPKIDILLLLLLYQTRMVYCIHCSVFLLYATAW